MDRPEECEAQVADIGENSAVLETACNKSAMDLGSLSLSIGQLQTYMGQLQVKGEENTTTLGAIKSKNIKQDVDLARLQTDIAALEDMERTFSTAVMIFEMMGESMPSYSEYQNSLDSIETALTDNSFDTNVTTGLVGDIAADAASITDLTDVQAAATLSLLSDLQSTDPDAATSMKFSTDLATAMVGRAAANEVALFQASMTEHSAAEEFAGLKVKSDYYYTNDGDMQILTLFQEYQTLFEFCLDADEIFEFHLKAKGEVDQLTDVFSMYLVDENGNILVDNSHSALKEKHANFNLMYKGVSPSVETNYKIRVIAGNEPETDVYYADRNLQWSVKTFSSDVDIMDAEDDPCEVVVVDFNGQ